ncbi:MAG TPA: divalent-cation tolerance protein CutA [Balneolales bacterium]|nr:divalent-cation tolerance protein CutA [Balneolales bacterium]
MKHYFVYITTSNREEAEAIGRQLVEEHLAACVNIVGGMHSIYWWNDEVNDGHETILIAKTMEDRLDALRERVVTLHSYDCPCIVALPIEGGHQPYLDWILKETRDSE